MTMDAPQRTRSCRRDQPAATASQSRGSRQICLPLDRATYDRIWEDPQAVRGFVEDLLGQHPELFPEAMTQGFTLCGKLPPQVPYHVVQYCFGRNAMSWYRLEQSLGRNSLVGTTVRDPDSLPAHLAADEHHAQLRGADAYVAMTAGGGCVLGMALSNTASEVDLTAFVTRPPTCRPTTPPRR